MNPCVGAMSFAFQLLGGNQPWPTSNFTIDVVQHTIWGDQPAVFGRYKLPRQYVEMDIQSYLFNSIDIDMVSI